LMIRWLDGYMAWGLIGKMVIWLDG
jgi:hypothetical protein